MTKPVISVAVMMLNENLKLDDPISLHGSHRKFNGL